MHLATNNLSVRSFLDSFCFVIDTFAYSKDISLYKQGIEATMASTIDRLPHGNIACVLCTCTALKMESPRALSYSTQCTRGMRQRLEAKSP